MASLFYFPVSIAISIRHKWIQTHSHPADAEERRRQCSFIEFGPFSPSLPGFLELITKHMSGNYLHLGHVVINTALFAVTIWFSRLAFLVEDGSQAIPHLHFGSGLAILRFLQGVTSTYTTFSVANTFEVLEWTVVKSFGVLLPTFLALSPTTSLLGLLMLLISCRTKSIDKSLSVLRWMENNAPYQKIEANVEYQNNFHVDYVASWRCTIQSVPPTFVSYSRLTQCSQHILRNDIWTQSNVQRHCGRRGF